MFPNDWQGWGFYEQFLIDPQGNRYHPAMVQSSIFTYQLHQELVGHSGQILSLKQVLLKMTEPKVIRLEINLDRAGNANIKRF